MLSAHFFTINKEMQSFNEENHNNHTFLCSIKRIIELSLKASESPSNISNLTEIMGLHSFMLKLCPNLATQHKFPVMPDCFPLGKVIYMLSGRLLPNEISSAITIKTKQSESERTRKRNDKGATVAASM
jgi:hypothetical protein